jgi:alkanesulfonate monooxygenase SsuD/methylene tetrahydromethanopterin reductase-like flavin-dependent oxidoreductase (luciferase family)
MTDQQRQAYREWLDGFPGNSMTERAFLGGWEKCVEQLLRYADASENRAADLDGEESSPMVAQSLREEAESLREAAVNLRGQL